MHLCPLHENSAFVCDSTLIFFNTVLCWPRRTDLSSLSIHCSLGAFYNKVIIMTSIATPFYCCMQLSEPIRMPGLIHYACTACSIVRPSQYTHTEKSQYTVTTHRLFSVSECVCVRERANQLKQELLTHLTI